MTSPIVRGYPERRSGRQRVLDNSIPGLADRPIADQVPRDSTPSQNSGISHSTTRTPPSIIGRTTDRVGADHDRLDKFGCESDQERDLRWR
jgi:hypothetical protein